ncbi:hypothetical protein JOB18_016463 [Solea senegalensis]|uniref:Uncharacterized protein n=1 Tax=Solea senegalensis TaxID=28829 RepID=A0AAV6SFC1_SOLSE|nr:hypothetical protein JOB18_016463 [Solea senegalensis]
MRLKIFFPAPLRSDHTRAPSHHRVRQTQRKPGRNYKTSYSLCVFFLHRHEEDIRLKYINLNRYSQNSVGESDADRHFHSEPIRRCRIDRIDELAREQQLWCLNETTLLFHVFG